MVLFAVRIFVRIAKIFVILVTRITAGIRHRFQAIVLWANSAIIFDCERHFSQGKRSKAGRGVCVE